MNSVDHELSFAASYEHGLRKSRYRDDCHLVCVKRDGFRDRPHMAVMTNLGHVCDRKRGKKISTAGTASHRCQ
jgi:hypothetical protein